MTGRYRIMDLLPGARNVMVYGGVQPGQEVLITTDTLTPPLITQALAIAVTERGARPTVVTNEPAGLHWRRGVDPPHNYRLAVYASDLEIAVLSQESHYYPPRLQETAMIEHGGRKVTLFGVTEADLASPFALFPYDVMHLMTKKIYEQWTRDAQTPGQARKTIRVTSSNGTNLVAVYDPRYVVHTGFAFPKLLPGQWHAFGGSTVGIELILEARGVLVFDGLHGEEAYRNMPPIGSDVLYPLSEPVRWVLDGTRVRIEGGAEAAVMRRMVDRARAHDTAALTEIALGVSPKAPLATHPIRHAGVTHYAIANRREELPEHSGAPPVRLHTQGHILRATIEVDGESSVVAGRLRVFDDPEVRAAAARYGDPDDVLEEVVF